MLRVETETQNVEIPVKTEPTDVACYQLNG
jgi:hypothetical protein